jgi:hypothetical protein
MKAYRFIIAALLMVLAACSQAPSPEVNTEELSSQAVLAGASGMLYYAAHNPTAADPYRIFRQDQTDGNPVLVYSGNREIQSVAATLSGGVVIVSMRETSSSSSDFEIFKITSTTVATQLTTNSFDDTNVSITRGGTSLPFAYKMAWETSRSCGLGCLKRAILVRSDSLFGPPSVSFVPNGSGDFTQPSISGNGQYIAFVRRVGNTKSVERYRLSTGVFTVIASTSGVVTTNLSDPSVSDDGTKVVYRTNLILIPNPNYSIKLSTNGVITNVVSGVPMSHPYLTADGRYITYAKQVSGAYRIVTRSLVTNLEVDATAPASPRNHYAPFWQKANP